MNYTISNMNIKDWLITYNGEQFDGVLCDPPYELGFMGKSWDSSGIAFDVEMWQDIFKLLKPGAHLLAFSGSRTYHRMAVAIEDAGFEIRDMIEWVYGSGFPKSLNIGKAVDKIQGNEREIVGSSGTRPIQTSGRINSEASSGGSFEREENFITKGTSEWEGYGTALKPAHEPCVLARKPIEGTVANNVLKYGTGGLNIDGTRVGTEQVNTSNGDGFGTQGIYGTGINNNKGDTRLGRFPANLIHDGSDEVEAVFPKESSRFFYTAKASKSERNAGLEGFEEQKTFAKNTSKIVRVTNKETGAVYEKEYDTNTTSANHHPTVKPLALTKYLATLIKPPTGGRLLVPFSGSGSEMIGALQAGWEHVEGVELTEEYIPIAEARIKYWLEKTEQESNQMELV